MKARGTWTGGHRTVLEDRRGHQVTCDLPHAEGGSDRGTSALELSVLSLAASITTTFTHVAKRRRLAFQSMTVDLDAEPSAGSPTILSVDGVLHVVTSATPREVEAALGDALRTCAVGVLFERAQIPVQVRAEVHPAHRIDPGRSSHSAERSAEPTGAAPPPADHQHHAGLERREWSRAEALEILESPERRRAHDPDELWAHVHLQAAQTVAEVGAGTGFFALPAARRVGPEGRVYAVELSPELVELLEERGREGALPQLVAVRSTPSSIPLDSSIADFVLLANVLHDLPPPTVAEAVRLLRPDGRFVNLDWRKGPSLGGPPDEVRLTPDEAALRLGELGLEEVERWEPGPWHYAQILRRAGAPTLGKSG